MKNSGKLVSFLVPIISILLAFVIGCIIMAVLGANPFVALESLWIGAFGSLRNVGTTLARSTPLIFTSSPSLNRRSNFSHTISANRSKRSTPCVIHTVVSVFLLYCIILYLSTDNIRLTFSLTLPQSPQPRRRTTPARGGGTLRLRGSSVRA